MKRDDPNYMKAYRAKNRQRLLEKEREYHHAHKEERNLARADCYRMNKAHQKEVMRWQHSKRRYGIYADAHIISLQIQEQILGKPLTRNNKGN